MGVSARIIKYEIMSLVDVGLHKKVVGSEDKDPYCDHMNVV